MKLTDAKIRGLKAKDKRYTVWNGAMGIRVGVRNKTFIFKYRFESKQKMMTIGKYPLVSLADAGMKVAEARKMLAKGVDPGVEHLEKKLAEKKALTVDDLASEYLEKWAKVRKRPRCAKEDERILKKDVLPFWGKRKAKSITRREVIRLLDSIVDRGAPIQANRTFACISKMFSFGVSRDIVDSTPCVAIEKPSEENRRDRVLNESEIRTFWKKLDKAKMTEGIRLALKLQLMTAQRKGEVAGAEWSEIDLNGKMWAIPGEKSKNHIPHRIPLSPQSLEILKDVKEQSKNSKWLFPSFHSNNKDKPIGPGAISHAISKNSKDEPLGTGDVFKLEHFSPHDLRRTAASHMTSMGIPRLVVSRILNHSEGGITSVYDRHSYDKEKRQALETWGRKMDSIITGKTGKVIALKRK